MSSGGARLLILATAGLFALAGCSSTPKNQDLAATDPANPAAADAALDTTGSLNVTPAEPGPRGEPAAPLATPRARQEIFPQQQFRQRRAELPQRRRQASQRCRSLGRARCDLRPPAPLRP